LDSIGFEEVEEVPRSSKKFEWSLLGGVGVYFFPSFEMTSQPDLSVPAVEDRYDGDGDDDDGSESEGLYEDLGAAEELEEVREEEVAEKKGRVRRKAADIVKLYGCPKCDKTYSALKVPNLEQCLQGKENSHMILFFF